MKEMKKEYVKPELEELILEAESILAGTWSGDDGDSVTDDPFDESRESPQF